MMNQFWCSVKTDTEHLLLLNISYARSLESNILTPDLLACLVPVFFITLHHIMLSYIINVIYQY